MIKAGKLSFIPLLVGHHRPLGGKEPFHLLPKLFLHTAVAFKKLRKTVVLDQFFPVRCRRPLQDLLDLSVVLGSLRSKPSFAILVKLALKREGFSFFADPLKVIKGKLLLLIEKLAAFCDEYKALPTLGFTHFQPAQLTTVGKRFALYLQDFVLDLEKVERQIEEIPFRSVKGTTGTQASFLELFDGDHAKCRQLEKNVAKTMGFDKVVFLSGQTYTRKIDYFVLSILSGIAQSASKMATDVRLLASMKEIEEPFGKSQVGSSAMAYKRNPMRSERVCSLARYVMSLPPNAAMTEATQWFERTLDDSANRRISLPEAFLATDVVLAVLIDIASGFQVWPKVIERHVKAELPFMATENLLMEAVKRGGDRQQLHEVIREHSMEAAKVVKAEGKDNDLLERLKNDPAFASVKDDFDTIVNPAKFVGRAPEQVADFLAEVVNPILEANAELLKGGVAVDKVNV